MRRLILHIGQYKTGSSSIQASLAAARDALRGQGVLYPATGTRADAAHGAMAAQLRRAAQGGPAYDKAPLMAEIEASGCDTVILSCEGLSGTSVERMDADLTGRTLAGLGAAFADWAITVVYYWRRQDEAVESRIAQTIKGRGAATAFDIDRYLAPEEALDTGFFHGLVAAALPQATIVPRCLAPGLLVGGEVVGDFIAAAGLPPLLAPGQVRRTNITPSGRLLGLQRALNRLAAAGFDIDALQVALRRWPGAEGPKAVLIDAAERQRIMDYFAAANARALATVVPPDQRAAVADYLAAPVSTARPNAEAGAGDLAALLAEKRIELRLATAAPAEAAAPRVRPPAARDERRGEAVRLYLGAHKTASTHLQDMMVFHRATLATHGTTVSHPGFLRGADGWLAVFYQAVHQREATGRIDDATRARLRAPLVAGHDWLVSDENILGTAMEAMGQGSLYAWAVPRFHAMADLFADRRVEVFMALRSYDSFFPSIYSEVLRNNGYIPFAQFRAGVEAVRPAWSWLPTVEGLVAAFGEDALTLWDFADLRALQPRVVALLSGIADGQALIDGFPPRATRPSLSERSIALIGEMSAAIGPEETLKLTQKIDDRYGVDAGFARFSPYDPETAARLRRQYADDLAQIRRRWPRLRFLAPDA